MTIIEVRGNLQGLAIAITVIAIPIGWFEYQIYDSLCHEPYQTKSFCYIKDYMLNMKSECCHAVLDYILMEDFYKNSPGLYDTIGGFWDHYKARRITGIIGGFFSFVVLLIGISKLSLCVFLFSIGLFVSNYIIFKDADRIRKEVELREFFLVLRNKHKLEKIRDLYLYPANSDCLRECIDP
jgi:uncharacterized membrane protein